MCGMFIKKHQILYCSVCAKKKINEDKKKKLKEQNYIRQKEWNKRNREKINAKRRENRRLENINKPPRTKYYSKTCKHGIKPKRNCRDCINEYAREWRRKNKDRLNKLKRERWNNNKEEFNRKQREYRLRKREEKLNGK